MYVLILVNDGTEVYSDHDRYIIIGPKRFKVLSVCKKRFFLFFALHVIFHDLLLCCRKDQLKLAHPRL